MFKCKKKDKAYRKMLRRTNEAQVKSQAGVWIKENINGNKTKGFLNITSIK